MGILQGRKPQDSIIGIAFGRMPSEASDGEPAVPDLNRVAIPGRPYLRTAVGEQVDYTKLWACPIEVRKRIAKCCNAHVETDFVLHGVLEPCRRNQLYLRHLCGVLDCVVAELNVREYRILIARTIQVKSELFVAATDEEEALK